MQADVNSPQSSSNFSDCINTQQFFVQGYTWAYFICKFKLSLSKLINI